MSRISFILAVLATLLVCGTASAATYPAGFEERTLVSGLTEPTAVDWTPDGRTLVLEKNGVLKVAQPGSQTATAVLDISAHVNSLSDRGALGLAVDTAFATNQYVYVLYTYDIGLKPDRDSAMVSQLLRIKLSPSNVVTEQTPILGTRTTGPCPAPANDVDCLPSDGYSHSIGTVRSAPDGTLYLGSGDAADWAFADPMALRALDERSLAGKIIHIDREGRGLPGHPFCPANTNLNDVCTKVWARGLRNPFRFELRPNNGGLIIGDVGWNQWEELNIVSQPGRSFGWPCYEGAGPTADYQTMDACKAEYAKPAGTHTAPVTSWCHCTGQAAAVGGPEYTGTGYPAAYRGSIFYGDYALGWVKRAVPDGNGGWRHEEFASGWMGVALNIAPGGDLAYVSLGNFQPGNGSIVAVGYAAENRAPVARITTDRTSGAAPLAVQFDGRTSSDPDGDALTYKWSFGDGTTSTAAAPAKIYTKQGTYTATLTVDDGRGRVATASVTISAGNTPPTAKIGAPGSGGIFRAGSAVHVYGSGTDTQDGTLGDAALTWKVLLHHNAHVHALTEMTGAEASFTPLDDHDLDSYYEVTLTATDSGGLTSTDTIRLDPAPARLRLDSEPAGAPVTWGGVPHTAPFASLTAIGFNAGVSAADRFTTGGRTYEFTGWSDGGAISHQVTVPEEGVALTAKYKEVGTPPAGGPVLALNFDETSGTRANDVSGKGNHATLARGAAFATGGRTGRALALDGVDDWATVADSASLDLTNKMTLEAWVRPRSRTGWRTVLMKEMPNWQSYVLYGSADRYAGQGVGGEPVGFVDGDGVRGPAPLPLNAWSHLAMTYDGATQRLYVDGTLVSSVARTTSAPVGTGALRIGNNGVWNEAFDGLIDDVRVYDRALSATEVARDRDTPVSATPTEPQPPAGPQPVAAYGFEEAATTITADASPNAELATLMGGVTRTAEGKRGRALSFDGVDDRVIASDAPQLRFTSTFTLSAWVRPTKRDGWRTVIMKERRPDWQSYALYAAAEPYEQTGAGGEPVGFSDGVGVRGPSPLPLNTWSHLAFVTDGVSERLYVDGNLVSTRASFKAPVYAANPLSIGGNAMWGEFFAGGIDEVRLFGSALDQTQVRADMDRTAATAMARVGMRSLTYSKRTARAVKAQRRTAPAAWRQAVAGRKGKVLRGGRAAVTARHHRR